MEAILSTMDVALRLHCSVERVRQLAKAGRLPAQKLPNGRRIFRAADVDCLAAERAKTESPEQDREAAAGTAG